MRCIVADGTCYGYAARVCGRAWLHGPQWFSAAAAGAAVPEAAQCGMHLLTTIRVLRRIAWVSPALLVATVAVAAESAPDLRPNILLIVADDLGYSDIGPYGGEIRTPNLGELAAGGLTLSNYHTSPTCGPTRAMLMTGVDHHRAGIGTNAASLRRLPELRGRPGYEGFLNDRVVTLADLLGDAGYRTYVTGKWDLGASEGKRPTERGFDRYFGIPLSGASHFSDMTGVFRPVKDAVYLEDEERLTALPDDFYSSADFTDRMLEFIDEDPRQDQPWFAYVAYTAPHWPLQVPDDWIDRYRGQYNGGWHQIRKARFDRQRELGLLPADAILPEASPSMVAWDSMLPGRRDVEIRRMEIYAAMVELMDHHIGRLLDAVTTDDTGRETIIVFLSDNGAEGNDIGAILDNAYWIPATFDNRLDNMGRSGSYVWLGAGWGQATSAPYRLYKSFVTEGGIRAPAIISSSTGRFTPGIRDGFVDVRDITPTLLELAGTEHPGETYRGRPVHEPDGRSALAYLQGDTDTVHGDAPVGFELYGNRAIFSGSYKAVLTWPPEGDGRWALYDLQNDPTEAANLAERMPERLERMVNQWQDYAEQNGVAIFERDLGYGRYGVAGNE